MTNRMAQSSGDAAIGVQQRRRTNEVHRRSGAVLATAATLAVVLLAASHASANDWPYWRGPEQTGATRENAAVTSWSQDGDNLLWRVPIGGRTAPIVMNGRLYAICPAGSADTKDLGERVVCLDADTGKTIWEHRFNVFHTDIVEVRLGWTSMVGDPETGNVYAHGTGGELFCFDRDGKLLWKWSLTEEFGRSSGYGGRLHSPIIDEDRVIISYVYILSRWGTGKQKAAHRYMAFDKRTGKVEWTSIPGGRPFDTTYSVPVVTVIDGKRMLIGGNADGHIYGMLARTGEKIWSFKLSDRRGINASVVVDGNFVYAAHSEENSDTSDMGRIVCIDASKSGDITSTGELWRVDGLKVGYSSPAIANGRMYAVTNAANLHCLDTKTGREHWTYDLGRVMKGSPAVTADGVIYAGEVNGTFHILRDEGDKCVSLDVEKFSRPDGLPVEVNGSPVVADGRVYFMTTDHTYCLGTAGGAAQHVAVPPMAPEAKPDADNPASILAYPAELTLAPGQEGNIRAKMFDKNGVPLGPVIPTWSISGVECVTDYDGNVLASSEKRFSAGTITAEHKGFKSAVRVRVSPKLPIDESFDDMPAGKQPPGWIGLDAKTALVARDDGAKSGRGLVLMKKAEKPSAKYARMRSYSGPVIPTGYTVEADLMASPRAGKRPVLSDMGLINSRYKLIMLGYEKAVRIVSYSPIPRVQVDVPFDWKGDTWYRAKFTVEVKDGKGVARGKIWPRGDAEPDAWTVELSDPSPNHEGSPGLYALSKGTTATKHGSAVYFDNYRVYR